MLRAPKRIDFFWLFRVVFFVPSSLFGVLCPSRGCWSPVWWWSPAAASVVSLLPPSGGGFHHRLAVVIAHISVIR